MRRVPLFALGFAAIALIVAPAVSAGSPRDRVTGGGQTLVGTQGAGNTIAFTAQQTEAGDSDAAKGQVQYINREDGTGQDQRKFHGTVECIEVDGNRAVIGGTWDRGDGASTFEIVVVDNGQGAAANDDMITIYQDVEVLDCSDEDEDDPEINADLARGNAQVYDASNGDEE